MIAGNAELDSTGIVSVIRVTNLRRKKFQTCSGVAPSLPSETIPVSRA
jgi:hypothetical protein